MVVVVVLYYKCMDMQVKLQIFLILGDISFSDIIQNEEITFPKQDALMQICS